MPDHSRRPKRRGLRRLLLHVTLAVVAAAVGAGAVAAAVGALGAANGSTGATHDRCADPTTNGLIFGCFSPDETTFASCAPSSAEEAAYRQCWGQALGNMAYREGPLPALRHLEQVYRSGREPAVTGGCHLLTHVVGSAALLRYDGDAGRAFVEGHPVCSAGYYHGILLSALADVPADELGDAAVRLCRGAAGAGEGSGYVRGKCAHATGHGLLVHLGYTRLPDALKACDEHDDAGYRHVCHGGVFMENLAFFYGLTEDPSPWIKASDPLYPCNAVEADYRSGCWVHHSVRLLYHTKGDERAAMRLCRTVGEDEHVEDCFWSLGLSFAGAWGRRAPAKVGALCAAAGDRADECMAGAAGFLIQYDIDGESAGRVCRAAHVRVRATCFRGLGTGIGMLNDTPAEIERTCRRLSGTWAASCVQGAEGENVVGPASNAPTGAAGS